MLYQSVIKTCLGRKPSLVCEWKPSLVREWKPSIVPVKNLSSIHTDLILYQ